MCVCVPVEANPHGYGGLCCCHEHYDFIFMIAAHSRVSCVGVSISGEAGGAEATILNEPCLFRVVLGGKKSFV